MKVEWEKLKQEFRENHTREDFLELLPWMNERENEHRKYLDKMSGLERKRFINEYLYDQILYSWKVDNEKEYEVKRLRYTGKLWFDQWIKEIKNEFHPWTTIDLWNISIWDEWAEKIAREWKNSLQLWMKINLMRNNIWDVWMEILAKEWKESLQPWMEIDVYGNNILAEWVEILAKEWKNSLQPWMIIDLWSNNIWVEWVEKLAKEWKESLQSWMTINLKGNHIWDEWAKYIIDNMKLKKWVTINLEKNGISEWMKQKLKEWEMSHKIQWINCRIKIDE